MKSLWRLFYLAMAVVCVVITVTSCAVSRPRSTAPPPPSPQAVVPPPRIVTELRGVWVSDPSRLDWDRATADLERAGFNTMYVNFASGGAAFFPGSRVLPDLSTATPADWISGITLAHRRGIAVHAKLVTMFMYRAPPVFSGN